MVDSAHGIRYQVEVTGRVRTLIRKEMINHCSTRHRAECEKLLQFDMDALHKMETALREKTGRRDSGNGGGSWISYY